MVNKYLIGLSILVITTGVVQCKPGYLYYYEAEGWLKLHKTPATWEEAYLSCHDEGAVLASPITKGLVNTLHTIKRQANIDNKNTFVGTHALFSKGDYISIEGVPLDSMDVEVSSYGEGDCLSMDYAKRAEYHDCLKPLSFICYKTVEKRPLNECGTFDDKYQLNQKTGSCYKVYREKQTWSRASSICFSEGGYLAIVNDEDEAEVIKDLFPARNQSDQVDKFSVGLAAFGRVRVWITIRGDSIADVYNKWNSEQSSENRGAILSNGKLDAVSADGEKLMFVCEKSPKFKQFEGSPPTKNKLQDAEEPKLEIKN